MLTDDERARLAAVPLNVPGYYSDIGLLGGGDAPAAQVPLFRDLGINCPATSFRMFCLSSYSERGAIAW